MRYKNLKNKIAMISVAVLLVASTSPFGMVRVHGESDTTRTEASHTQKVKKAKDKKQGNIASSIYDDAYAARITPNKMNTLHSGILPGKFDLRSLNQVSPVKNGAPWETSWVFGAMAALESNMLVQNNMASVPDYSELQIAWNLFEKQTAESLKSNRASLSQIGEGHDLGEEDFGNGRLEVEGNAPYVISVLSAWQGAANETDIPYQAQDGTMNPESDWAVPEAKRTLSAVQLKNALFLPSPWGKVTENNGYIEADEVEVKKEKEGAKEGISTKEGEDEEALRMYDGTATIAMKKAIMEHGALNVACFMDQTLTEDTKNEPYMNYEHWAQYVSEWNNKKGKAIRPNHSVSIVGWDDDFSKDKFNSEHKPVQNGAWIVKNSWGSDWGQQGYFWLSYYDKTISQVTSFQGQPTDTYDQNYQYDFIGYASDKEWEEQMSEEEASVANVFTVDSTEELKAVSAAASFPGTTVRTRIYKLDSKQSKPIPDGASPFVEQSNTLTYAGYHTIPLNTSVLFKEGESFSVVQTLSHVMDGKKLYDLPMEMSNPEIGQTVVLNQYESYLITLKDGQQQQEDVFELSKESKKSEVSNVSNVSNVFKASEASEASEESGETGETGESGYKVKEAMIGNVMIKAFTKEVYEATSLKSFTYQAYDGKEQAIGERVQYTNVDTDTIALPQGTAFIKIEETKGSSRTNTKVFVDGAAYTLDQKIERTSFMKEEDVHPIKIVVTGKDNIAIEYAYAFTTTPIVLTNEKVSIQDTNYHLEPATQLTTSKVHSGEEYNAVKAALAPLDGANDFVLYSLALQPALTAKTTVHLKVTVDERFTKPNKTALFSVEVKDGVATLSEVGNLSNDASVISGDVGKMGYYVLAEVKEAPPIPALTSITYNPNQTLAAVTFPTEAGGTWRWDTTTTVPTVDKTSYPATFTPSENSSFRPYKASIPLTTEKAKVVITTSATAITYGQTLMDSTVTGTASLGETQVSGTYAWENLGTRPSVKDADKVAYGVVFTPTDKVNYHIAVTKQSVSVHKKAIAISVEDTSKVYGSANPAFTFSVAAGGLVGMDTLGVIHASLTSVADERTNAGTKHAITGSATADNYNVRVNPGTLTITKRPLSVMVDAISRPYGTTLPEKFTYTIANLVNGDREESVHPKVEIEVEHTVVDRLVGTYALQVKTFEVTSNNYTVADKQPSATLTITPNISNNVTNTSSMKNEIANLFGVRGSLPKNTEIKIGTMSDKQVMDQFEMYVSPSMKMAYVFDLQVPAYTKAKGKLTVRIPVDNAYNGQNVMVLHYVDAGKMTAENKEASQATVDTYKNLIVTNGMVEVEVHDLSPFALLVPVGVESGQSKLVAPNTGDDTSQIPMFLFVGSSFLILLVLRIRKNMQANTN